MIGTKEETKSKSKSKAMTTIGHETTVRTTSTLTPKHDALSKSQSHSQKQVQTKQVETTQATKSEWLLSRTIPPVEMKSEE
jgi:hypothetical protein